MTSEHENQFSHLEMSASRQQTGLHKHTHTQQLGSAGNASIMPYWTHRQMARLTHAVFVPVILPVTATRTGSLEEASEFDVCFFFFFVREQNYASNMDKRCMQRSKTRCLVTVLSCEHQSYEHLQTNVIKPEMAQLTVLLVDMRTFSC